MKRTGFNPFKNMKTFVQDIRIIAAFAIVFAAPGLAPAAVRHVDSVTPNPDSANVEFGIATNVTSDVAVASGSGASSRYKGIATISASVSPAEPTVTATMDPTTFDFPNANVTSNSTLTVTTTAGTPVGTYVVSIIVDTNPPDPSAILAVTNFFTLNVGAVFLPEKTWSPGGADTNWSTGGNWLPTGAPTPSNDLVFVDLGAVGTTGLVDNVVDTGMTVGSLMYGQTNNFHTTLIPAGVTLTVGGDEIGLVVGTGTDPGDGQITTAAITGAGGTLAVNDANASVTVSQSHSTTDNALASSQATLDLSGLDTFSASVSSLQVGVDTSIAGASGVLNMARTNTITAAGAIAPQIDVGDNSQAQGTPAVASVLLLGQTNALFADSIAVGRGKTDGPLGGGSWPTMLFNSAFSSPSAYFRGSSGGASRVGTWFIGDGYGARTYYTYGTCDFSLGTVNALVDTMYIGRGASTDIANGANNPGTGTLTFGAGSVDVNTLEVGYSTLDATGTGTLNASGGSLLVNTLLELGHGSGSSGTLNLTNATVSANGGIVAGGGIAEVNMTGGTLNATNNNATIGTIASPITTFGVSDTTQNLAVQKDVPTISTTTLNAGGSVNTINIASIYPPTRTYPGQYQIIQYSSSSGDLNTFVKGTLPGTYQGYILNNTGGSSVDLVITNGPVPPYVTWTGVVNSNWDTTTMNWKFDSGTPTTYVDNNYFVTFDDTLTGTTNVNLTTTLTPLGITFNNTSSNYVFTGSGSLGGNMSLSKSGSGKLTLSETGGDHFTGGIVVNNGTVVIDNDSSGITGGTTINSGTVEVGNNDAKGVLPSGDVTDNSSLVFNRTDNLIVTNNIAGSGTLIQSNVNIVTLSGNSTFAGTASVAKGTLQVGSANGLGLATAVTVNSGATLDADSQALYGNGNAALIVTVSGAGVGGNGAIVNNGASQSSVLHTVTLTGDTTFGGAGDWDIRNSKGKTAPADGQLSTGSQPYGLTKVGTNQITLRGVQIDGNLGAINVFSGELHFTGTATAPISTLGNTSSNITVFAGGTLTFDTIGNIPNKGLIILNNGGTLSCSDTNTLTTPVSLTGITNNTFSVNGASQFTINSVISGTGGFSKNGSSVLMLTTANTYSGDTVVSGGTLALYGNGSDGSILFSTNININAGATLDVSGRSDGTLTLASGQTLNGGVGGSGAINGILVANSGSFVAPGTGTTNIGTLTVSSNATLQGTTLMSLNAANGINDQLAAYSIAYGGTLIVTNVSGVITNSQSFQLFASSTGYSGTFAGGVTLPSALGLTWINTLATDGKVTAVVTTPAQPHITGISLSGTSLILNGTNGTAGQQYEVLSSTNVALPLTSWNSIMTNTFDSGNFSVTNTVNPTVPQQFYLLRIP